MKVKPKSKTVKSKSRTKFRTKFRTKSRRVKSKPESKLAIIIRSHGGIPTNIDITENINDNTLIDGNLERCNGLIQNIITPPKDRTNIEDIKKISGCKIALAKYNELTNNFAKITTVTIAKQGGVCYGDSDITTYISAINKYYSTSGYKRFDKKINDIFGKNPPSDIKDANNKIFGISFSPVIVEEILDNNLDKKFINKVYNKYDENSGVYLLGDENIDESTLTLIKNALKDLTETIIKANIVTKFQILNAISQFKIDKLVFIDLTCNAYYNIPNHILPLNESYVNWMNGVLEQNTIMGGSKRPNPNTSE